MHSSMTETPQCPWVVDVFPYFQLLQVVEGHGEKGVPSKATLLFAQWWLLSSSCVTFQRHLRQKNLWLIYGLKVFAEATSKVAGVGELSCVKSLFALYFHHVLGQGPWNVTGKRWWRGPASPRVSVMECSSWQGSSLGGSHHSLSSASGPQAYCFLEQGRAWTESKVRTLRH